MAELTPYPIGALARRMFRELELRQAIFDLPARKFFAGHPALDLGVRVHGARAGSPLGPAAGPHTQMAQNIVLAWLAGARVIELKTVQVLDRLEIPRPCIDMQTVGLNAEWSQELRLEQSLEEYVKAAMLIAMLRASGLLLEEPLFSPVLFDMSVGYDLAGIRSDGVQAFLAGMRDATPVVERLRRQLPAELGGLRDLDFPTRLAGSVTLSTFHGCPPAEVEGIAELLLEELGLSCTVKLNPTLLGRERVRELLHGALGYEHLQVPDSAFEKDLQWEQAVAMLERLQARAAALGLGLGAKLSNTLLLTGHRGFIPASVGEVYLSGAPLHVLAMDLVQRFRATFGDRLPLSFAAGVDRGNVADAVALGLVPVTACSDLLQPGGYGRLAAYHQELCRRMEAVGAATVDDFVLRAYGHAEAALVEARTDRVATERCRLALARGGDLRAAAGDGLFDRWVAAARLLNTRDYAARALADPRYGAARNGKPPRKVGSDLALFDCLGCDKCVQVCPNDANFTFPTATASLPAQRLRRTNGRWQWQRFAARPLGADHQIANFADLCNDCGNCDVFCPEDGKPYQRKPRFFGSEQAWRAEPQRDGLYAERRRILGRFDGDEYCLERGDGGVRFSGPGFSLAFDPARPEETLSGEGPDEIDLTWYHVLDTLHRGVFAEGAVNYVNCLPEPAEAFR